MSTPTTKENIGRTLGVGGGETLVLQTFDKATADYLKVFSA